MDMAGVIRTLLLLVITVATTNALEARKVLNIPEKIIGGVIDIVQSHKNKPTQLSYQQSQQTQQVYQGYPQQYAPYQSWNTGIQATQTQNQGQYVYPTQANYNTNTGQYPSGQQVSGQYPVYQGSYQTQNQNGNFEQSNQYQSQSAFQGQGQYPVQGQQMGQYQNMNQQSNTNFQGTSNQHSNFQGANSNQHSNFQGANSNQQQFQGSNTNQQATFQQPTTGFGSQQTGFNQQSNYVGQSTFGTTHPQVPQTGFGNQQTSFQGTTGSTGSGGFPASSGHQTGPGPACVCQAWTKPQEQRSEVLKDRTVEKSEEFKKSGKSLF